jgi:hypothetical protein
MAHLSNRPPVGATSDTILIKVAKKAGFFSIQQRLRFELRRHYRFELLSRRRQRIGSESTSCAKLPHPDTHQTRGALGTASLRCL